MNARVITISREYGSGGHEIARMIGEKLGLKVYDKNLVNEVAKQSGMTEEFIERSGEQASRSSLFFNTSGVNGYRFSQSDQLYIIQTNLIRDIAEKESCVIVGRCADYILNGRTDCLHVFIHASDEYRKDRIIKYYGVEEGNVKKVMKKIDKERKSFYEYYTELSWGDSKNFHLCIDSSVFGLEKCADMICQFAK